MLIFLTCLVTTCKEVSILPTPLVSESAGDPRSALGVTGGGGAGAGAIK